MSWSAGGPSRILDGRYFTGAGNLLRHYDVTADGQRFLMLKEDPSNTDSSSQIIVVQNWLEELKSKAPIK